MEVLADLPALFTQWIAMLLPEPPFPAQVPQAWLPVLIFLMRTAGISLATLRMLMVVRGRRLASWTLAFIQSLLYVTVFAGTLANLRNPWNLVAFAGGFATGNVFGMTLESLLAPGHSLLRISSAHFGAAITEALRSHGWGATELPARGREGMVSVIYCYVPRREVPRVRRAILAQDPEAFITALHVRPLGGGWHA